MKTSTCFYLTLNPRGGTALKKHVSQPTRVNQLSQHTFFVEAGLLLEAGAFFAGTFLVAALALEVGLAPVIACES